MRGFEKAFGDMPKETRDRIRETLNALPQKPGRGGLAAQESGGAAMKTGGRPRRWGRWAAAAAAGLVLAFGTLCAVKPDVAMAVPGVRDLFKMLGRAGLTGFENLPELESDGTFTVQRIDREVKLASGSVVTIGEAFFDGRVINVSYHYEPFAVRPAVDLRMNVNVDGEDRGGETHAAGTNAADEAVRAYLKAAGLPESEFETIKTSPWKNTETTGYLRAEMRPDDLQKKSVKLTLQVGETQPLPEAALGGRQVDGSTRLDAVTPIAQDPRDAALKIDREKGIKSGDESALNQVTLTSIPIGADAEIPIEVSMKLPEGTTFAQKTVNVDAAQMEISRTRTPMRTYVQVRITADPALSKAEQAAWIRGWFGEGSRRLSLTDAQGNPIEAESSSYGDDVQYTSDFDYPSGKVAENAVYLRCIKEQDGKNVELFAPIPLPE